MTAGPGPVVCGVQLAPRLGDVPANTEAACRAITVAADEGASLVVLPEAALTGYVFSGREAARAAAVETRGPELSAVGEACRSAGAYAVVGAIERADDKLYNSAFLAGPEGIVGRYRKLHTLCLGVDRFTTPGAGPLEVWELPFGRVGIHICYDGTFPETARALKLLGAQLVLLPTNWPTLGMRQAQVRVRAWENHVNFFAVNRVGAEEGVEFLGGSLAADYGGRLLAEGGSGPEYVYVSFDFAGADESYVVERPGEYEFDYIADRRPDCYGAITDSPKRGRPSGSRSF